jgi:LysM repeat protein
MKAGGECLMKDDLEPQMNDDDLMNFKELNRPLKDDLEREVNDDNSTPSPKRRKTESDGNRLLPTMIVVLLVLIFAGGIYYFITRHSTEGDATIQSKMTDFEQKITNLERQIAELQGKLGTVGPDSGLLQRLEALAQKVEALEKRAQPKTESKLKLAPQKSVVAAQKRYHTVQKGETLSRISKRYGITVEELCKLNNLLGTSPSKPDKILISVGAVTRPTIFQPRESSTEEHSNKRKSPTCYSLLASNPSLSLTACYIVVL